MKDRWSQLSMSEKSDLMSLYIRNGISSLEEIKKHYNSFATGGFTEDKRDNSPDDPPNGGPVKIGNTSPPVDYSLKGNNIEKPFYRPNDPEYIKYWETLPDNQKYTSNDEYDSYLYWQLNGKPRNFQEARRKGMFTWDSSDNSYHGNSIAYDKKGNGRFIKPKKHDTVKYELDWYNKGLITEEGGVQRQMTPKEKAEWENFRRDYELTTDPERPKYYLYRLRNQHAKGGHLYQDGGSDDDNIFVASQASETGWMPEVNIVTNKPSWQQGLTDYDWARARQYYSDADGNLTNQGIEFLKNISSKRTTGQSNFMKDVNKLSYIPNAAVGAICAIPVAAGLIASAPIVAEAAAPYVIPAVKSMVGIKNLAGLGLSMGLATGVDQTISDNSDYKSLPNWANQTFFNGSPETEQALEFFRPEYMFAPYASKVVNKGIGLVNNAGNAAKPLHNSKVTPVLADALYKDASFNSDPIMQMLYTNYISGESTFGNLLPQKTVQTGLDDDAIQLLRNRTLNRDIQAIKEDPNLSSSFLGESRIKKLNEIFDKDLPSIKVGKYSGQDYKNAGHRDWGGFYNEESQFISINKDSGMPVEKVQAHEGLHHIDSKHSLTAEQDAALSKAFADDFNTLPETEYAPENLKDYTHMRKERITTNRDARDELLGYEDMPLEKQNQIIDQATDDAVFNAIENANGYGRAYIKRLRAENKLTHEKANAFRESMKKVGVITGIIGTGATLLNNNKK